MRSPSSSATDPQARAWFLTAEFDVAVHTRLTNSDTDQIFPDYVRHVFKAREKNFDSSIKGAKDEILARAWKFEAVIDAAHYPDLIDARGEIFTTLSTDSRQNAMKILR